MQANSYSFTTTTHGKWILTGEHAVLRGSPAIIFPIASRALTLNYQISQTPLQIEFINNPDHEILKTAFLAVLKRGAAIIDKPIEAICGNFYLTSNLPISAGMGASAALCVAIGRWFIWQQWLAESELYNFARELENLFHAESSGADIAACMANAGVYFKRDGEQRIINMNWQPIWFLSHCQQNSTTADCVQKVKALWQRNPVLAQQIDRDMQHSVYLAEEALKLEAKAGLDPLKQAIDLACSCFVRWGLTSGKVAEHLNQLRAAGALAVKPTGSGDGGFVLSLWQQKPANLSLELINLS